MRVGPHWGWFVGGDQSVPAAPRKGPLTPTDWAPEPAFRKQNRGNEYLVFSVLNVRMVAFILQYDKEVKILLLPPVSGMHIFGNEP